MDVLVFEVGGQRYGLPAAEVQEIVRAVTITRLPKAPPIVEGVVDVRGTLAPVLDLRARFGLPPKPAEPGDSLILARAGPRLVAVRADRALELVRVDPAELTPAHLVARRLEYVAGVARLADGLLLIHDLRTFLSMAEAQRLDEAVTRRGEADGGAVE